MLKFTVVALTLVVSTLTASAQSAPATGEKGKLWTPPGLELKNVNRTPSSNAHAYCTSRGGMIGPDMSTCQKDAQGNFRGCRGACLVDGKPI